MARAEPRPRGRAPTNDEAARRAALESCTVFDSEPAPALDRVVRLAQAVLGVPAAAVTLIDGARVVFKARAGLDATELTRARTPCNEAMASEDLVVVADARRDPRFRDSPLIAGPQGFVFYAGAPLRDDDGRALGALCVFDRRPRRLNATQRAHLRDLAQMAVDALEPRRDERLARAAARLAETETLFRAVTDAVPGAINVKDRDGRYVHVNAFQAAYYGLAPEDLIGTKGEAMPPAPEYDARLAAIEEEVWRTGRGTAVFEEDYLDPRGRTSYWWTIKAPVLDDQGRVRYVIGLSLDMTERKAAERALAASEKRYREIVETQSELVVNETPDGTLLFVNEEFARYFGGTPRDWVGRNYFDLVAPDMREAATRHLGAIGPGRLVGTNEERVLRPDGAEAWIHWTDRAVLDADGRLSHLASVGRDVTDRRRAEDALRESQARMSSLANTAPVLLWMNDADDRHQFQNQAWLDFFGLRADQVKDAPCYSTMNADDAERVEAVYRDAVRRRASYQVEFRSRRADGAWRWLKEIGEPRFGPDGAFVGYTGACLDITQQKTVEAELEANRQRLDDFARAASDWQWETDADHRLVMDTGYEPGTDSEVYVGYTRWDMPDVDPDDPVWAEHRADLDARRPYKDFEYRCTDRNGRRHYVRLNGIPRFADDGTFLGYRGTGRDVTDLVATKARLRASRKRLDMAAEGGGVGLWTWDAKRDRVFMDRRLLAMFGLPPSDDWQAGFRHGDILHPDDAETYRKGIEAYVASGAGSWETQYRIRGPGGAWTWILERGRIVGRDANGHATRMSGSCVDITERETAKIALAEAESRLRSLADTAPVLLWISDADDKVELANRAFRDFYGVPEDTPIGEPWLAALHPDDRAAACAVYEACWAARRPYRIECRIRRRDGAYRWLMETAAPRFGPDGAFAGYAGASLDVTDQKTIKSELLASRERLELAIQGGDVGLWDWHIPQDRVFLDPRLLASLGLATSAGESQVESRLRLLIHPDEAGDYWKRMEAYLARGTGPWEARYRLVCPSGVLIWVLERGRIVESDADGRPMRMAGSIVDITERETAKIALAEAESRLRSLAETAPVLLWISGTDHLVHVANPAFRTFYGIGEDGPIGDPWLAALHPDDYAAACDTYDTALEAYRPYRMECRVKRHDGAYRWLLETAAPRFGPDGAFVGYVGASLDVTEREAAKLALAEAEGRLRSLADTAPVLLWISDADANLELVNRAFRDFYGLSDDGPVDHPWRDAIHPDDRDENFARYATYLEHRLPYTAEYRLKRHDGEYRWFLETAAPRFGPDGAFAGYAGASLDVTESKRASEALRLNQLMLRRIIDAIPATIALRDREGRYLTANVETLTYAGVDADAIVGKTPFDFYGADEAKDILARDRAAFELGVPSPPCEYRMMGSDGVTRHWLSRRIPIRTDEGAVTHVLGITFDVTELKRAEHEAARARRLMRMAIDATPAHVALRDRDGRYALINAPAARRLGTESAAMIGQRPERFYPPAEAARMLAADRAVFETGVESAPSEETYVTCDGCEQHWIVHRMPLHDEDGTPSHVLSVGYDFTERKQAEQEIVRSRAFLREVMDAVPIGVSVVDPEGRFTFVNKAEATWLGAEADAVVGRTLSDYPTVPAEQVLAEVREVAGTGRPIGPSSETFADASGRERTWLVSRIPSFGVDGSVVNVISVIVDVTDQRRLEDQLRHSAKLEAIGQLTGGIAHDFNNLLAVVVGNIELAGERALDRETRKLLATALGAALRGGDLTQRLLAFARRQPMAPTVADVGAILEGMSDLLERTLGDPIDVSLRLARDPPPVRVDANRLETAVLNLAINARDAMPRGGTLTIATDTVEIAGDDAVGDGELQAGRYVVVSVSDTGEGIDRATLARVFEPFFTTKDVGKGTGLGLSMVYGFARQSGGDARIASLLGRGTTVSLYLPAHDADAAMPDRHDSATTDGDGESILRFEDDGAPRAAAATSRAPATT